jgi:hypothetical protein
MSFEILTTDQGLKIIHITDFDSDSLSGRLIQFANGEQVAVYNAGNEWVQCKGDRLNTHALVAIGKCINEAAEKKNSRITDGYFYDMLI